MIALARKYRPRNFASVAVQTHVATTLKGAIARGRVAHGYLLCGPRGVGKTTLARVLAMALNCERRVDGEPCGECESCQRIWAGSASLDVVEIDAASNRGVDDARELRERAMYAPSGEHRYKVYIVDEAHMLTREAWNALLKILEEPPSRVVFVFATTEPQKIAQSALPVLSRLQRFDLKRIGPVEIRERLSTVLSAEGLEAEQDALVMLARAADGSMRDALSLTDQVLALGEGSITTERVRHALGLVAEDEQLALLDLIAERRASDVFPAMERLMDEGVDLNVLLNGFADMLRAQLAVTLGAEPQGVSDRTRQALQERKERLAAGDLLRMLHLVGELEPRFKRSGQQQTLFEVLLVRLALLDRTVVIEELLAQLGGAEPTTPTTPAEQDTARRAAAPPSSPPPSKHRASPPVAMDSVVPRAATPSADQAPGAQPNERSVAAAAASGPLTLEAIASKWDDFRAAVRRERPVLATFVDKATPHAVTASGALMLDVSDAQARDSLRERANDLAALARTHLGAVSQVLLRDVAVQAASEPPAARMTPSSIRSDTMASLRKRDPVLNAAIDELDLELLD
ncbi:MAG TPA: DNA polymerase III subunit gamma/tau [Gemmatimonadaceae bacterium]|nr:DNA polymerase III subunit gamma/tau [Gemmatimonadaceae bacterium]